MPTPFSYILSGTPGRNTLTPFVGGSYPTTQFGYTVLIPKIEPSGGIIYGGVPFEITNGPSNLQYYDTFPGITLNPALWVNTSSGGGSATVDNGLILQANAGTASIKTVAEYPNFNVSITYTSNQNAYQYRPTATFTIVYLKAMIDSNNYFQVSHEWNSTQNQPVINVTMVTDGTPALLSTQPITTTFNTLTLVRYQGHVRVYLSGSLITDYVGWQSAPINIEIGQINTISNPLLITTVSSYTPATLVTFGQPSNPSLAINNSEDGFSTFGLSPSYGLPELADVQIFGVTQSLDLGQIWQYTAPLQLTVSSDQSPDTVTIADDDNMTDTSSTLPGLRL